MLDASKPLRPTVELTTLSLVLAVGAAFRLIGIDWDAGQHLHPDERFMTMVASSLQWPATWGEYFATDRSPLNPSNAGYPFYVYGTLPLFVVRAVAGLVGAAEYTTIHFVGRAVSAIFDCGTIAMTWWLGRLLVGPRVGLAAAALMAGSVVSIQNAHFFTVDAAASFFTAAALVALAGVARGDGAKFHLGFGAALAAALACRINLVLLGPFYIVAVSRAVWTGRRSARNAFGLALAAGSIGAILFRVLQPYAFAGPGFFDVIPARDFVASLSQVRGMVTGALHFPPANQWIGRTPILFPATNLFFWGLGPAFGAAGAIGVGWCLLRRRPASLDASESWALCRLVAGFAAVMFAYHGTQFVTTLRYFLPMVPVLAVAAAWLLARRRLWLATVIAASFVWALAFSSIYRNEHPRVAASRFLDQSIPSGATIAVEEWDDALPLPVTIETPPRFEKVTLNVYAEDTVSKRDELVDALDRADVLVLSSRRAYRSIPRSPWRYPLATRYYELLFAGELGFRLERTFTSYPTLGKVSIVDDGAEEQFTVYDHPKVLVFIKEPRFSRRRVETLFEAVPLHATVRVAPRDASSYYRRAWPADVPAPNARPTRTPGSLRAALAVLAVWELSALAVFSILFPVMAAAYDRGFALSKLLAWLVPGFGVFWLAATGVAPQATALHVVAAVLWTAGAWCLWRRRARILAFVRTRGRELAVVQGVSWIGFSLFATLRALNPSVFWGEKPMDFAILNALYRAPSLPPADPWFAGEVLNYNYFGHLLVTCLGKLAGVPPAFAFNLGVAVVAALTALGAYAVGRQLAGPLAGAIALFATALAGSFSGLRLLLADPGRALDFDFFWRTSRVIEGTVNEFPFWSFVFGDLHAHVLALPFDLAIVYAGALWLVPANPVSRRSVWLVGCLTAGLAGASAATSQWNIPVALALPFVVALAAVLGKVDVDVRAHPIRVMLGALSIGVLSRLLFAPFWSRYTRPNIVAVGWETMSATIADVATIFGSFWLVIVPLLVLASLNLFTKRQLVAGCFVIGPMVVAVGVWRSEAAAAFAGTAALGAAVGLGSRSARERVAALMVALAGTIGVMTELVYVSDRMNTVFKYYFHIWWLLAIAAAVLMAARLAAPKRLVWCGAGALIVAATLFTSAGATYALLRHPIAPPAHATLDGVRYLARERPGEWEAFRWMAREIRGSPVVLEAQGPSYELYSRVSMNTGLPTVLGWEYHLMQQARPRGEIAARREDVRTIFETTDRDQAAALMDRYDVDYVFVGPLERETYAAEGLAKFETWRFVESVFDRHGVTIYARPGARSATKTWVRPVAGVGRFE